MTKSPRQTPGQRFRLAVEEENPLQIVGVVHAYAALQAQEAGFRALYLSGAGVANASLGLPDLAVTNLNDVLLDASRITGRVDLPLLVDIDTGWGNALAIGRAVRELTRAGVAAVHLEDQVADKRCGHRPGKQIVAVAEMQDRIKSAVDQRPDPTFVIMARTDAVAVEGIASAVERCQRYVEAGADMIFAEALESLDAYRQFTSALKVPVLANQTEFGKTPIFSRDELASAGVRLILYPLSAFRAMAAAAQNVYHVLRNEGSARLALAQMQTREQLYQTLDYHRLEQWMDHARKANAT